jgi:hypothetical protein
MSMKLEDEKDSNLNKALEEANNNFQDYISSIIEIEQKINDLELKKSRFEEVILLNLRETSI